MTNHYIEAQKLLATLDMLDLSSVEDTFAAAQVHATLAVAAGLVRLVQAQEVPVTVPAEPEPVPVTADKGFPALLDDVAQGIRSGLVGNVDVSADGVQVFGADVAGWLEWCARYGATTARVNTTEKATHYWAYLDFAGLTSLRLSVLTDPSDAMPVGDGVALADIRAALTSTEVAR
jgi:hypothetical protein